MPFLIQITQCAELQFRLHEKVQQHLCLTRNAAKGS